MRPLVFLLLLFVTVNPKAQTFQNILISDAGSPEEVSICISPKDTNLVVAGANITDAFYSHDGGYTWVSQTLVDPYGVFGDPCLIADTAGNFFYFHLANDTAITVWPRYCDRIVLQKSTNGGVNFDSTSFTGYNLPKMQDKAWAAIDPATNYTAVSWTQFDNYSSPFSTDSSHILFSISKDGGISWATPTVISSITGDCLDSSGTVEGAVPAFGLHGEIYDIWAHNDSLYLNKSVDTGNTWLSSERALPVQITGWDYDIAGLNRCNGLPVTLVDHSNSAYRGTIYVNWTDKRNGVYDADVFISKSTDGGNTWTTPLRVNNDPPGHENFMSTMTIDQITGDIYILFYDRRNYGDLNTDVYMAYSFDGGNTFANVKTSTTPFYPNSLVFFGDYIGISAVNGCIRPAWMRMDNGETSVWEAIVNKSQLQGAPNAVTTLNNEEGFSLSSANPTTSACIIHHDGNSQPFEITITDLSGKVILKKHVETETFYCTLDAMNLSNGTYIVNCQSTTAEKTFKVILMR